MLVSPRNVGRDVTGFDVGKCEGVNVGSDVGGVHSSTNPKKSDAVIPYKHDAQQSKLFPVIYKCFNGQAHKSFGILPVNWLSNT
mmetsp:Transcript_25667/g.37955  ORF Transcript_25667/g.37955 Transcript_25667/m.37955 type:complete len:84 (+) Transcript_25667:87-338(+)